jgi:hypothetical protein
VFLFGIIEQGEILVRVGDHDRQRRLAGFLRAGFLRHVTPMNGKSDKELKELGELKFLVSQLAMTGETKGYSIGHIPSPISVGREWQDVMDLQPAAGMTESASATIPAEDGLSPDVGVRIHPFVLTARPAIMILSLVVFVPTFCRTKMLISCLFLVFAGEPFNPFAARQAGGQTAIPLASRAAGSGTRPGTIPTLPANHGCTMDREILATLPALTMKIVLGTGNLLVITRLANGTHPILWFTALGTNLVFANGCGKIVG